MATQNAIDIPLTASVTNGGTGQTTLTNHSVLVGAGTSAITQLGVGTSGQLLIASSAADPIFATPTSTAGSITYTTGANALNLDIVNYISFGTWTPVLSFGGASVGITYFVQLGYYTRIGNIVQINTRITLTSKGSSTGTALVSGLPLTSNSSQTFVLDMWQNNFGGQTNHTDAIYATTNNSTTLSLFYQQTAGVLAYTDAGFNNTSQIDINGIYVV